MVLWKLLLMQLRRIALLPEGERFNDALRYGERRLVFDVEGLRQLAAQSVGRSPTDILNLSKFAEGGSNRTFLITMRDDFQMVARIPYPVPFPKYYAVASELATMDFLRSSGLPVPQVYGYSPTSDNAANTEFIFMGYIRGAELGDVCLELEESDIVSILRQLVQLEFRVMSISVPVGESLYYAHDLEKVPGKAATPLKDGRFCVGPDTGLHMWYGRRSQLDVDRGPYESTEAALVAPARNELAYLEQFGQPLLPFRRERREGYQYQEHHPDLQPSNIIVRKSPDSDSSWQIISLLDWQHASILPLFLHSGIPQRLQNHDDPVSQSMTPPSLPKDFDKLEETERGSAKKVYRRRLVHYHYGMYTAEYNKPHYDTLTSHMCALRRRLFELAGNPWEGETLELKVALIRATERSQALTEGQGSKPCPVKEADELFEMCQNIFGPGSEGWVPPHHYEEAVKRCRQMKEAALRQAEGEEERGEIEGHWPWDDMDEGNERVQLTGHFASQSYVYVPHADLLDFHPPRSCVILAFALAFETLRLGLELDDVTFTPTRVGGDPRNGQDGDNGDQQEDEDLDCGRRLNWGAVAISDKTSSLPLLSTPTEARANASPPPTMQTREDVSTTRMYITGFGIGGPESSSATRSEVVLGEEPARRWCVMHIQFDYMDEFSKTKDSGLWMTDIAI
ncbi:hypothetical protein GALMADRAFT_215767 [Galerina marginata CBS 339.88]|uniref:Uncharacterized protein n=1 Tax=Galerina marginata (strain CBS 339.88) TaxID=685588 RepID=A0A067SF38_GALM3|nr:hypothetical protein GALMADRAFT_215767 [Galerina marginata CBS 339.88]